MDQKSCIVAQFQKLADLTSDEIAFLQSLEKDAQQHPADSSLCEAGEEASCFYTVHRGWACATRNLPDGQRQVLDIFLPGQVMGLRDIGFRRSQSAFVAITDVEICPFPRQRLKQVFSEAPRLTQLFFLVLAREQAMLTERIINVGRRPAIERLAHFLLEMKVRVCPSGNEFALPLNQTVIGDALGLSAVHVSRTLRQLRQQGWVEMDNGDVCIRDIEALVQLADFNRAYLDCESDWARQSKPDQAMQPGA